MARLEATIDANINPFQHKLEEAREKAAEFREKLGEVGSDLLKNLSGINIGEALKLGVGIYAAKQLGEALVDAAKEGYAAFQKFQDAVLSFKYTLPSSAGDLAEREKLAKEEAEAAEKRVGAFDFETQYRTAQALIQASTVFGESMEKTDEMAKHLTALAIITRSTPEAEAENLRRALVSRKEDSGEALGKFFKRTPGLEEQARLLREQEAARHPEEGAEIRRMGIPQFMAAETRGKGDDEIIRLLTEMIAKAAPEAVIEERKATHPEEALKGPLEAMGAAFGEKLLPLVAELTDAFLAALPAIKEFGLDILDLVLPMLGDVVGMFKAVASALSFLASVLTPVREGLERFSSFIRGQVLAALSGLWNWLSKIAASSGLVQAAFTLIADTIKAAAGVITNAVQTIASWLHITLPSPTEKGGAPGERGGEGGGEVAKESKEASESSSAASRKAAEEAAEITVKADAAHAESARRINAEAEASDIRLAAKAEARAALTNRPIGATKELDKEYAARAAGEAKIINIRAEAAVKINAAEEEEAGKLAKIKEEADLRSLKRAEEDRHTFGMTQDELDARNAVRNAEDKAAANAINDAKEESGEKIREANADANDKIIDAQIAAADQIIDAQEAAALAQLDKMKGPYEEKEEAPPKWGTASKFGKGGEVIEGSIEREAREKRNEANREANRQWKELQRMAIEKEFEEKKRAVEDSLERQRPTEIGLKRTHILQQEEHVKAIEAEKGRTEADVSFAKAHKELGLPEEPKKEATGKADISRAVLAELLGKLFVNQNTQIKEFEAVFLTT